MIRTQLYLPEEITYELKLMSRQLNLSLAETIRRTLTKGIAQVKNKEKKYRGLEAIVGMIKSDKAPKNLSQNLDKYLY